jgi:hypothetical protein
LGTQSFGTVGTATWTVPAGVTRVYVQAWGGGTGGGRGYYGGGGGGAGGGYAAGWCATTPGASVTIAVGTGGAGGTAAGAAPANGGNSSFGNCITATGGGWSGANQLPGMDNAMFPGPYLMDNGASNHSNLDAYAFASLYLPSNAPYLATRIDQGGSARSGQGTSGNGGWIGCPALGGGGGGGTGARSDSGADVIAATAGGLSGLGGAGGRGSGVPVGSQPCTAGAVPGGGGGGMSWDGSSHDGCGGGNGLVQIWW